MDVSEVIGRWFFARWLGGSCRLANSSHEDGKDAGVTFFEGRLKVHLQRNSDGWWEGPKGSGLKLFRHGPYLVLHRERGGKGNVRQVLAATSPWAAACLCYKLAIRSMVVPTKEPLLVPPSPAAKVAMAAHPSSLKDGSSTRSEDDEFWPEPEAEGQPEQPSTAQEQNSLSLLLTVEQPSEESHVDVSDEKLVQQPQVDTYCLGVTSTGHRTGPGPGSNVVSLGVDVAESMRKDGPVSEPSSPKSSIRWDEKSAVESSPSDVGAGVNLDIPEEERSSVDPRRSVAEVTELRIGMHGLITVPEDMEIPDVPNPIAPSKSDNALLHGSVAFEGDLNSWFRENYEIPEEVAILPKAENPASSIYSEPHLIELGSPLSAAAIAHLQRQEGDSKDDDPGGRPNPLVRSNQVTGNLTR